MIILKLFDVHNDLLTQRKKHNFYLEKFNKEINLIVILVIFLSEKKLNINEIINLTNTSNNRYFAIEDISNIPLSDLDKLKEIKPLYCSLTWNDKNILAGGAHSKYNITKLGIEYIRKIEEFSYVDSAHLNKKSFYKLAKITTKPLLNSHTNLCNICKHKRNINNKQIKTIIKSNGLICLTGVKEFLGKDSNLDTYINSIYYFYKKYGDDNLSIASDFMGSFEFPLVYNSYKDFYYVYDKLKELGLNEESLNKIFYLNAIKFFKIKI